MARAIIPTQRVEQWQKPSLQACSRLARHVLASPARLVRLTCRSATTCAHAHTGAWCHAVARASRLGACLQAACRADESGVRRPMPHLQASMAFMSKGQGLVGNETLGGDGLGSQTSTPFCGKTAKVLRFLLRDYCSALGELSNAVPTVS